MKKRKIPSEKIERINHLCEGMVNQETMTVERAKEIGEILLEVKSILKHGEFLPWLKENYPFSLSQARRCMKVAKLFYSDDESTLDLEEQSIRGLLGDSSNGKEKNGAKECKRLARKINDLHEELTETLLAREWRLGKMLIEVKRSLRNKDKFWRWVERNCPFTRQQAREYIRLAALVDR